MGEAKIIYITPEYLTSCEIFIKDLYDAGSICCIAIDESHCVSSWGIEFRTAYTQLNIFKEWMPDIPIIALTAHALEADRVRAMEAGADDFDTKPVDLARLLGKIEALT